MAHEGWEYDGVWDWSNSLRQYSHPHSASLIRQCDPELAEENTRNQLPQLKGSRSNNLPTSKHADPPPGDAAVPEEPSDVHQLERRKSRFARCLPSMFRRQER